MAAGSSWSPATRREETGMRKRKGGQAPSVSVDVERIPSSVQVSAVVEEEERTPLHKGGEKETASV